MFVLTIRIIFTRAIFFPTFSSLAFSILFVPLSPFFGSFLNSSYLCICSIPPSVSIISSIDTIYRAVLAGAIRNSAKQRDLLHFAAVALHSWVCGIVHEVCKAQIALGMDSKPTELEVTLRNHALLHYDFFVLSVYNCSEFVDTPYAYRIKLNDDVTKQLGEVFRNEIYASAPLAMIPLPANESRRAVFYNSAD